MKELDVLLERYLERHFPGANDDERTRFARLLELEDPELYALCMGRRAPELVALLAKIRAAD